MKRMHLVSILLKLIDVTTDPSDRGGKLISIDGNRKQGGNDWKIGLKELCYCLVSKEYTYVSHLITIENCVQLFVNSRWCFMYRR